MEDAIEVEQMTGEESRTYWEAKDLFEKVIVSTSKIEPILGLIRDFRTVSHFSGGDYHLTEVSPEKRRIGMHGVVKLLYEAYNEGSVESLEGLPKPEDVLNLNRGQIASLILDLINRYFPIPKRDPVYTSRK